MDKHTPGPWFQDENRFGTPIITGRKPDCCGEELICVFSERNERKLADAERIVACVNACREFSNEMLLDDGLVKLRNDRDELLAALQSAIADIEFAIEEGHPFGLDETLKILKAKGANP